MDSLQGNISNKRTYTVDDIAVILDIGKAAAYDLVKKDYFRIVRIGKAIRISKSSFDKWLDQDAN